MPNIDLYLCVALVMCSVVALAFAAENFFLRQEKQDWKEEAIRWRRDAERLAWQAWGPVEEREHVPEETLL